MAMDWETGPAQIGPLLELRNEVDRLFDQCLRGSPFARQARGPVASEKGAFLSADLVETEREFLLNAEVPGVPRADLDVTITSGQVTIRGERKPRTEKTTYFCRELHLGPFRRVIRLPSSVVPNLATAKVEDGVLTVTLPKAKPAGRVGFKVRID